jgi:hypothetical protein
MDQDKALKLKTVQKVSNYTPQNHYVPRHKNNRYINSYYHLIINCTYVIDQTV